MLKRGGSTERRLNRICRAKVGHKLRMSGWVIAGLFVEASYGRNGIFQMFKLENETPDDVYIYRWLTVF